MEVCQTDTWTMILVTMIMIPFTGIVWLGFVLLVQTLVEDIRK